MSSASVRVPRESLRRETLNLHYAIASPIEELEVVDWFRQRADECDGPQLKAIPLHNAREEFDGSMAREWIRRDEFDKNLREYLFSKGSIAGHEEAVSGDSSA